MIIGLCLVDTCQIGWGMGQHSHPGEWSSQNHCENREIQHQSVKVGSEAGDENLDPFHHARWARIRLHQLEAEVVQALGADLEDDKGGLVCYLQGWGVLGRVEGLGPQEGKNGPDAGYHGFLAWTPALGEWHGEYLPQWRTF